MSKNNSNHRNISTNKAYYNKSTLYLGICGSSRSIIECFLATGTIPDKHTNS